MAPPSLYEGYNEEMIIHLQTGCSATLRAGTEHDWQMAMRHGPPWETLPILQAKIMTTREDMLLAARPPSAAYLWGCCPHADTYDSRLLLEEPMASAQPVIETGSHVRPSPSHDGTLRWAP